MATFITEFLSGVTAWLTGIWTLVSTSLTSAVAVFYNGTTITIPGAMLLFGLAFGLVSLGLSYVVRLVRK